MDADRMGNVVFTNNFLSVLNSSIDVSCALFGLFSFSFFLPLNHNHKTRDPVFRGGYAKDTPTTGSPLGPAWPWFFSVIGKNSELYYHSFCRCVNQSRLL